MEAPANERLRTILGEDYDEESMQKMIGHAIETLIPDKVEELIKGIGCMGPSIYKKYGIIDEDKIKRIKRKIGAASIALSGGARKRRTQATTVKQRKSSRCQLPLRRHRTNKK